MSLSIDAWAHLTKYTGPPCGGMMIDPDDPPVHYTIPHARLHTDPKTADEIREEFGLEPDVCYEGVEHFEFDLDNREYYEWLYWLEGWNPEALMAIHGGDDDNAQGAREAAVVLEALNPTLFEATFGAEVEIRFGEDEKGYYGAEVIYRDLVRAYGLAAQGGLITFR